MKMKKIIFLSLFTALTFSACSTASNSDSASLDVIAPKLEMTITSSKTQVSEFVSQNEDFTTGYPEDECFNITPSFISDNSDFAIYKYNKSDESFIMYDGDIYSIGRCLGGFGITSMALADINKDNQYELYYTFSWGSGIHRSQIGYFNPADKEVTILDYSFYFSDMMLTVNEVGDLCVNGTVFDSYSSVDFSLKPQSFLGTIVLERGKITFDNKSSGISFQKWDFFPKTE